jgi:S1-C subfamily serine protease
VGIDTAAEQGRRGTIAGYAIPVSTALAIAEQIQSGQPSANITIGYPAFLGVQVTAPATTRYRSAPPATAAGAPVSAVIPGSPAARACLSAGDTITAIDGTSIGSAAALTEALAGHTPGQDVTITWIDPSGAAQSASLTLATGPAA